MEKQMGDYRKSWHLTTILLLEFVDHPAYHKQHGISKPRSVSRLTRKGSDAYTHNFSPEDGKKSICSNMSFSKH
jgi:hypothetical protein